MTKLTKLERAQVLKAAEDTELDNPVWININLYWKYEAFLGPRSRCFGMRGMPHEEYKAIMVLVWLTFAEIG